MQLFGNMISHLHQIIEKIDNNTYFGIIRPGDGEYLIIQNTSFTAQPGDDWTNYSNGILGKQLLKSLKTQNPKLYIGIPCDECGGNQDIYIERYNISRDQLTYANIFCNANYTTFLNFLKSYSKQFYLITSGIKECDLPIKERYIIDKFLVNNWDYVWESETNKILNYIKDKKDELICFAAGPITKVWIPMCMDINPNNIYLDIGSTLDLYTKGTTNPRPYTNPSTHYSKQVCNFRN